MTRLIFTFAISVSVGSLCQAQDQQRSKAIHFEDELVEGINRRPLDSFNQVSEGDLNSKSHLYRKRSGFTDRDQILIEELRIHP
jgi:hypothetical protein